MQRAQSTRQDIILVNEEPRGPSVLFEIPVTNAGVTQQVFPDNQQLKSLTTQRIIIKQIKLITLDVLTNGPLTGLANAPLAELKKMSLVLYSEGWEKGKWIPILQLNDEATPAGTFPYRFAATKFNNWENVDWTKSYINYSNGTAAAGTPYCVLLDVLYEKLDASGYEIIGPS